MTLTIQNNIMKPIFRITILLTILFQLHTGAVKAQCGGGFTPVGINWDYMDFLANTGSYAPFISLANAQTQRFSIGNGLLSTSHNYSAANSFGEVATHTGDAGSFGTGDDVRFMGNGEIILNFSTAVRNLRFSLYDIDRSQRVAITATNGLLPVTINVGTTGGTILTPFLNNSFTPSVNSSNTVVANTSNVATANFTIANDVTRVTITITNTSTVGGANPEDGSFFLSDISACAAGASFPANYYSVVQPFVGQPDYVLVTLDNSIYYTDVNTGISRLLFTDPAGFNVNSMAYDPYNRIVYYTYSLTPTPTTDRTIWRYDYNTGVKSAFVTDVNTLGIRTYYAGVESGGAAFYDGALYIGIEGAGNPSGSGDQRSGSTNRESTVWRIERDASLNAVSAKQVFALPVDNGAGTGLHDWSDFSVTDGVLYDFDGAGTSAPGTDIYHQNLLTGSVTEFLTPSFVPRQTGVDANGVIYNIGSPSPIAAGTIVPYNLNGTINLAMSRNITYNGVTITGSWGDAGEAFKPLTDFGDAPTSYDPAGSDPATHEVIPQLRLGNTAAGIELTKKTSANATGDGPEEDGVAGLQVISTGVSSFVMTVSVFNNTGANATLAGWIDANGDGVYQTSEGRSIVVPSNAAQQSVFLSWPSINVTLPANSSTFFRLRITSASNGMTTANPRGYFGNGEVEDFPIAVSVVLPEASVELKAQKNNTNTALVSWESLDESNIHHYELEKSTDGVKWVSIYSKNAQANVSPITYTYTDVQKNNGTVYYRINIIKSNGANKYSNTSTLYFDAAIPTLKVTPNPSSNYAVLSFNAHKAASANIQLLDASGKLVYAQAIKINAGQNMIKLDVVRKLNNGQYNVKVQIDDQILSTHIVIVK